MVWKKWWIKLYGWLFLRSNSIKSFVHPAMGMIFTYRQDSSDLKVYHQVIENEEYRPVLDLIQSQGQGESIRNIIDAGANIGLTTLYFSNHFTNARIFSLEPNEESYQVLKINTLFNRVSCQRIPMALWHTTQSLSGNRSFRDGMDWSFAVQDLPAGGPTLNGISIPDLAKKFGVGTIDLLKIDIEGSEFEVFKGDLSFLDSTRYIALEIHPEVGDPDSIHQSLKDHGFVIFTQGETCFGYNPLV